MLNFIKVNIVLVFAQREVCYISPLRQSSFTFLFYSCPFDMDVVFVAVLFLHHKSSL